MKTKRTLIQLCLLGAALLALPAVVQAQFIFTTNNGAITITQYIGQGGDVTIPDTVNALPVTTIGPAAFYQVSSLTSVTFGTNVTTIANNAIFQCPSLASVTIPASVTNIGQGPFLDCKSLTAISVNSTNAFYSSTNGILFDKNKTMLIQYPIAIGGSYMVTGTVVNIGEGAFGDAFGLASIVIPNSVTNIVER